MQRPWAGSMSGVSEELLRMLAGVDYGGWGEELREIKPESPQKNFYVRTFLVVQWLRPRPPQCRGPGFSKRPYVATKTWGSRINKNTFLRKELLL